MANTKLQVIDATSGQIRSALSTDNFVSNSGDLVNPTYMSLGGTPYAVSGSTATYTYFGDIIASLSGGATISLINDIAGRAVQVSLPSMSDSATLNFQFMIPDTWHSWYSDAFAVRWRPFGGTQTLTVTLTTGLGASLASEDTTVNGSSGATWTDIITSSQLVSASYPNGIGGTSSAKNQPLILSVNLSNLGGVSSSPILYDVSVYFLAVSAGTFGPGTINRGP